MGKLGSGISRLKDRFTLILRLFAHLGFGVNGQYLQTTGTGLQWNTISSAPSDGDKGDVIVSGTGTVWTLDTTALAAKVAGIGWNAIGSYAFALNAPSTEIPFNTTRAGGNLTPSNGVGNADTTGPTNLTGTWRCMGHCGPNGSVSAVNQVTLWQRIS